MAANGSVALVQPSDHSAPPPWITGQSSPHGSGSGGSFHGSSAPASAPAPAGGYGGGPPGAFPPAGAGGSFHGAPSGYGPPGGYYGPPPPGHPGSYYGPPPGHPGSYYGPPPGAPGSYYGPPPGAPGSYYPPPAGHPGSYYGPPPGAPGSYYGPPPGAPGSYYPPPPPPGPVADSGSFHGYPPAVAPPTVPTLATIPGPWLITVEVLAGRKLKIADSNGLSDPYCKITIGGKKFKTRIIKKNLNPEWNERFSGPVYSSGDRILIHCIDHDRWSKDDPLGYLDLPISHLELDKPEDKWHQLKNVSTGDLHLRITASKFSG